MSTPKVSIGMPVYNGSPFIREALDSLLNQTFTDFELIISDNASTDETESICREYAAKDPRIRYVRQPENRGALLNFRFVLDEAVGTYFMWAAADDRRGEEFLKLATSVLECNHQVGLVFSWQETKDLLTGESQKSEIGFSTSRRKLFRILFRIHHGNSCLVYGLHRMSVIRRLQLESMDYWDVYLAHWYELNSLIVVIPAYLFIAGTIGKRVAYSVEGRVFISYKKYLSRNLEILKSNFNPVTSFVLYLLIWWLIYKNSKILNRHLRK